MKFQKNCFWSFIPARSNSKTIKNKNLLKINKKTLIEFAVNSSIKNKFIIKTFFSSDSRNYLNIAKKAGCKNLVLRDKKFSGDKTSDFIVFQDFLKYLEKNFNYLPEFIVHLRPTTPLRKQSTLNKAINNFLKKKDSFSSLRSVVQMSNPSFKTFIIKNKKLCSLLKNDFDLDKFNLPKEFFKKTYLPNGYIDIIKTKNIYRSYLHGNKVKPFIVNEFNSDIDDMEDYLKVKKHAEKK